MKHLLIVVVATIGILFCLPNATAKADELTDVEFAEKVLEALRGGKLEGTYVSPSNEFGFGQHNRLGEARPASASVFIRRVWEFIDRRELWLFVIDNWDRVFKLKDFILSLISDADQRETVEQIYSRCTPSKITVNLGDGSVKIEPDYARI